MNNIMNMAHKFYMDTMRNADLELIGYDFTREQAEEMNIGLAPFEWRGLIEYLAAFGVSEEKAIFAGLAVKNGDVAYDKIRGRLVVPFHDSEGNVVRFHGYLLKGHAPLVVKAGLI